MLRTGVAILARPSPTRDAGWWPRRQGVPTGLIFPRTTSVLTWSRAPAPVRRGMSPEPCCQRGNGTVIWTGPIVSSGSMRRFVERARCDPSALRRDRAQAGRCGCIPRKRYCSRPTPYSRVRPLPPIHRTGACERPPEEAKGYSTESGIMVL